MENKKIVDSFLKSTRGSFALDKKPLDWQNCREKFASFFDEDTEGFFFSHNPIEDFDRISEFIMKTEKILELETYSKIVQTNHEDFSWIEPAYFWKCCSLRRNLFTVFLRCALDYTDDYKQALLTNKLSRSSFRAICRFLYGFTKYTGDDLYSYYPQSSLIKRGWVEIFSNKSDEYIKKLLVREKTSAIKSLFINNAIWM